MNMKKSTFLTVSLSTLIVLNSILIIHSCKSTPDDNVKQAFLYGPGLTEPFQIKKDTIFRIDNLRSG